MPTSTTITFAGLLVFRRDPHTGEFEVGILRARDAHERHILQIAISPYPGSGPPPTPDELEQFIQDRNVRWELEVEGNSPSGVQAMSNKPSNRKDPQPQNDQDLGWIINLENDEFHDRQLPREPHALQPVIQLKHGRLFTSCKTDSVDTIQGGNPRDFGFIAGGISLTIDTSEGQKPVLNVLNEQGDTVAEILRLDRTDQVSYQISIFNTPLMGTPITENHFHLYYELLFTRVPRNERFDIQIHNIHNPTPPPRDRCDEAVKIKGLPLPTPNPFRCGGILVEGEEPLG